MLATAVATVVRLLITPLVGSAIPFVAHFAGAIVLAWFFGFWPAALSVVLSIFAGVHFILSRDGEVPGAFGRTETAAVLGFAVSTLVVSFLIDYQRKTLARAKAAEKAQAVVAVQNLRLLEDARQFQDQLKRSNEELTRANLDLEAFAYSAGHDLREPLRTIAVSAEWVEKRAGSQLIGIDHDFLIRIRGEALRMEQLIQDLLLYSQVTRVDDEAEEVNTGLVLSGVLKALRQRIEDSKAAITVATLPVVAAHERSVELLFQNLISNAIKYCDRQPQVYVSAEERGGTWVFSITDNGIGIEPQYHEQIFGLFKRLHGREDYPGTGVGLAICKRVAEKCGGRVWLEKSEPGTGSTFCFSIPGAQQRRQAIPT